MFSVVRLNKRDLFILDLRVAHPVYFSFNIAFDLLTPLTHGSVSKQGKVFE